MQSKLRKIFAFLLCFLLCFEQSGFAQMATELNLGSYLSQMHSALSIEKFRLLHLRYLSYDNMNNSFRLLLDKGSAKQPQEQELKDTAKTLLNYFFIGLALPNDSFWVNLRPDSPDNIIDPFLAQTDIGRIMLETDLQLKKDTALATSPQTPEGRKYWDRLYKKAEELFGYENITIPTLTRPWIVPGEIIIRETTDSAYIYKATLKVMIESDYLAKGLQAVPEANTYSFKDPRLKALNEYSSQLIRELIIPKLTREVNSSKRYSQLRQVYYSLILAQWFKARFSSSSLRGASKASDEAISTLINSRNLSNLTSQTPYSKTTYFQAYQKSFKDGEYSIQEPRYTPYGQAIRSYFSGGMQLGINVAPFGKTGSQVLTSPANSPVSPKANEIEMLVNGDAAHVMAEETAGKVNSMRGTYERGLRFVRAKDKNSPLNKLTEVEFDDLVNRLANAGMTQQAIQALIDFFAEKGITMAYGQAGNIIAACQGGVSDDHVRYLESAETRLDPKAATRHSGKMFFVFNYHRTIGSYNEELKRLIDEADIVILEEPESHNDLYQKLSTGVLSPNEVISEMEQRHEGSFIFPLQSIYAQLYGKNKPIFGEPFDRESLDLFVEAGELSGKLEKALVQGNHGDAIRLYEKMQDKLATCYVRRDSLMVEFLRKTRDQYPSFNILVIRGVSHTSPYILLSKEIPKMNLSRYFFYPNNETVVFGLYDSLSRKLIMQKLGVLPENPISKLELIQALISVLLMNSMTEQQKKNVDFVLLNRVVQRIKDPKEVEGLFKIIKSCQLGDASDIFDILHIWMSRYDKWTPQEYTELFSWREQPIIEGRKEMRLDGGWFRLNDSDYFARLIDCLPGTFTRMPHIVQLRNQSGEIAGYGIANHERFFSKDGLPYDSVKAAESAEEEYSEEIKARSKKVAEERERVFPRGEYPYVLISNEKLMRYQQTRAMYDRLKYLERYGSSELSDNEIKKLLTEGDELFLKLGKLAKHILEPSEHPFDPKRAKPGQVFLDVNGDALIYIKAENFAAGRGHEFCYLTQPTRSPFILFESAIASSLGQGRPHPFDSLKVTKIKDSIGDLVLQELSALPQLSLPAPSSGILSSEDQALDWSLHETVTNSRKSNKETGPGGIDFRFLPIVTQAAGNLSVNISRVSLNRLSAVNLDEELRSIQNMVNSGISPSSERIKEYIQASCFKGNSNQDLDKIILCISNILRQEEESCVSTEPILRDILVVLEAKHSSQELKHIFLGQL